MKTEDTVSTDVESHPEYLEESQRLEYTITAIRDYVNHLDLNNIHGGDGWATANLIRFFSEKRERIQKSIDSPYFGRIDFSEADNQPEKLYIGYQSLELAPARVLDWRAPISKLFYGSTAEKQAYTAPEGEIHGKLYLKRHYTIEEGELLDIADEVDRRAGKPLSGKMVTAEARLLQFLYSRGDPSLQDIVKSIQEQQDRIIRASPRRVLIINGVAGSGKTSIAYHRLTYLLYPDTQANIQANRTIVFAPNRLFLSYVSELLPRLGVREALQTTFDDWALEKMKLATKRNGKLFRKHKIQETSLNSSMDQHASQQSRAAHWQRARIKGG